mmetsp:Transcript_3984/g.14661  ORF Transcript_3984/g.14661 Transcript_3984/m.14661 type:complete len:496 (-) Transcript_3984:1175-2662(-)
MSRFEVFCQLLRRSLEALQLLFPLPLHGVVVALQCRHQRRRHGLGRGGGGALCRRGGELRVELGHGLARRDARAGAARRDGGVAVRGRDAPEPLQRRVLARLGVCLCGQSVGRLHLGFQRKSVGARLCELGDLCEQRAHVAVCRAAGERAGGVADVSVESDALGPHRSIKCHGARRVQRVADERRPKGVLDRRLDVAVEADELDGHRRRPADFAGGGFGRVALFRREGMRLDLCQRDERDAPLQLAALQQRLARLLVVDDDLEELSASNDLQRHRRRRRLGPDEASEDAADLALVEALAGVAKVKGQLRPQLRVEAVRGLLARAVLRTLPSRRGAAGVGVRRRLAGAVGVQGLLRDGGLALGFGDEGVESFDLVLRLQRRLGRLRAPLRQRLARLRGLPLPLLRDAHAVARVSDLLGDGFCHRRLRLLRLVLDARDGRAMEALRRVRARLRRIARRSALRDVRFRHGNGRRQSRRRRFKVEARPRRRRRACLVGL